MSEEKNQLPSMEEMMRALADSKSKISDGSEVDFDSMDIEQFLVAIDDHFTICKDGQFNRLSIEWGKWSRNMNISLRKHMEELEEEDEDRKKWLFVHAYWIIKSRLLNYHLKNRILMKKKIRIAVKELKEYRRYALGKNPPEISEQELARMLLKG